MANKSIKVPVTGGGDFQIPDPGQYLARCYQMVDIGTQERQTQWGTKNIRQVILFWELLKDEEGEDYRMELDGKEVPFTVMQTYTLSLGKKANLRADLEAWRGKEFKDSELEDFDLKNVLGAFCTLQIVHNENNGKTYANIKAIMNTKKKADGVNNLLSFSIDDVDFEAMAELPEWIQEKIRNANEWKDDKKTEEPKSTKSAEIDDDVEVEDTPF